MRSPQSRILLPAFLILFCAPLGAQKIAIPDIPGYKTLQCDFHLHTVFSDGQVWPTVRVDEAAREGLSAIAFTDHLRPRYRFGDDVTSSRNRTHDVAEEHAKAKNVIIIRGGELGSSMPPGHLNALFLKDCDAVAKNAGWRESLAEAKRQGAFISWNHPGWVRHAPDATRWLPEHDEIHKNGWMHGIEVANGGSYYPEAFQWALDKKLAMLGNTDAHTPIEQRVDFPRNRHRTMTLVFAKERTAASIRDALDNRRTVVFYKDTLLGEERWLRLLFEKCVEARNITHEKDRVSIRLRNNSDLVFHLKRIVPGVKPAFYRSYELRPQASITITTGPAPAGSEIRLEVSNFMTTPETPLIHTIKIPPPSTAKTKK